MGFAGRPIRLGVHLSDEEVLWCIEQFLLLTAGEDVRLVTDATYFELDPEEEWTYYSKPEDFGEPPCPPLLPT